MKEKNLVVKSNQLNSALQNLSLPELRIVQLAIIWARDTGRGLSAEMPLRIDATLYAEAFDTSRQNAYARMKETEETLFNRRFSYLDEEQKLVKSRWVSQVRYLNEEGAIEIIFTPAVVKGISRLDGAEQFFTKYLLSQTASLQSVYSVRIYELLIQWKTLGKTPVFDLIEFRKQIGLEDDEYPQMCDFKKRVLNLAVDEINEKTDLQISYEQEKQGRKISGFKFKIGDKVKYSKKSKEVVENSVSKYQGSMTEKQIQHFSNLLSQRPELSVFAPVGIDYSQFAKLIEIDLKDGKNWDRYHPLLSKLGYKD